jgi:hypothetical protein
VNPTQPNLRTAMTRQREMLTEMISRAMRKLSRQCVDLMNDRPALENLLTRALDEIGSGKHFYVMDHNMVQIVANITRHGPDNNSFGRDRSRRPYMQGIVGTTNFALSHAYISRNSKRPSLTAIRVIRDRNNKLLGFLGADFDLRELPATRDIYNETSDWQQLKGDPSIRRNLFQQQRQNSIVDRHIDEVLSVMAELITHHGVFHAKLHFSSSRAVLWMIENPFTYRLVSPQELTDPDICLAYPHRSYSEKAVIPAQAIKPIFKMLAELRFADENIYLRSGSLNICNGMVALNFSCDGSHYIRYDEFLANGMEFWFGAVAN